MNYLNVLIWLPLSLDSRISAVPEGRIIELIVGSSRWMKASSLSARAVRNELHDNRWQLAVGEGVFALGPSRSETSREMAHPENDQLG